MSDHTTAATPTDPPATPTVETVPATQAMPEQQPNWLPMRLEQAKRSALSEATKGLGVESLDEAKALIAKAKTLEEQAKSDIQKLTERVTGLEPAAKRAAILDERLSRLADAELSKLSDVQRAAVLALAKDDKTAALDAIEALRPTWAAAPAQPAPLPAPAKTSAATAPPAAAATTAKTDHRAIYESMRAENPMAAAQYLVSHARQIYPDQ